MQKNGSFNKSFAYVKKRMFANYVLLLFYAPFAALLVKYLRMPYFIWKNDDQIIVRKVFIKAD